MSDELLDLVDSEDRVIGTVARSAAHKNPRLIHREIAVLLTDGGGKVLVCRRALTKAINPGKWSASAAGHVGAGEDPGLCASRELKEELGIEVDLKLVGKERVTEEFESYFAYCYLGELPCDAVLECDASEICEERLCSKAEAEALLLDGAPTNGVLKFLLESSLSS
jgi:isopentenyl-diphosphate delta-isomerase